MQGWTGYTTADEFLNDEDFRQWVRSGAFMQTEQPQTDWLGRHPHLIGPARQAAEFLAATHKNELPVAKADVERIIDATWRTIRHRDANPAVIEPTVRPLWSRVPLAWRVAAALLIVSGLAGGLFINRLADNQTTTASQLAEPTGTSNAANRDPSERGPAWIRATNRETTDQLVSLSDGSTVYLRPGSTLHHPVQFATDRREVELTGEAFFEVAKNPNQPFFVRTRTLTTRVVGTSFLVRALERDERATVQVRTGRVVVYANQTINQPRPLTVTLRADQQVTVQPTDQTLTAEAISQPSDMARKLNRQSFIFADEPVALVLDQIAKTYNIPIDYDAARFANCRITTTLSDEPLTEKLSVLAEVIGPDTRYEVEGNHIRFSGRGCP